MWCEKYSNTLWEVYFARFCSQLFSKLIPTPCDLKMNCIYHYLLQERWRQKRTQQWKDDLTGENTNLNLNIWNYNSYIRCCLYSVSDSRNSVDIAFQWKDIWLLCFDFCFVFIKYLDARILTKNFYFYSLTPG